MSHSNAVGPLLVAAVLGVAAWAYVRLRNEIVAGQQRIITAVGQVENELLDAVAEISSAAHSIGASGRREPMARESAGRDARH